jgi:predicted amidohydrolase
MIISPRGAVVAELAGDQPGLLRATVDRAETSDWYLSQRRRDVVDMRHGAGGRELR